MKPNEIEVVTEECKKLLARARDRVTELEDALLILHNCKIFRRIATHAVTSDTIGAAKVKGGKFVNLNWIYRELVEE